MTDLKKYLIRFGFVLLIVLPILFLTQGFDALKIMSYKVCMVTLAIGLSELIWAVFFRPVYGKTEELAADVRQSVMLFRGILYAAVLLALTLGL